MVPWVGLQCVIVVFPVHAHLFYFILGSVLDHKKNQLDFCCTLHFCTLK